MMGFMDVFPFAGVVKAAMLLLLVPALMGSAAIFLGIVSRDAPLILLGSLAVFPAALLWFLLWRSYHDDGYAGGGEG